MDAIKTFLLLFIFIPCLVAGQKTKYPKDTIYVKYTPKEDKEKWHGKFKRSYNGNKGIFFNIKDKHGDMVLFYNQNHKADTLCTLHLKDYKIVNLKEIREQEINWVDRKFKRSKYKPYSGGSKNSVFHTYLIEVISKDYFVIYPVIWRNEGAID